jgi:hypothetical protein
MLRISVLTLIAWAAFAQNPGDLFNKPPANVDKALRARINEFYEDHVKQQFRKADALVAADTKEFFYTQNKPAYLGCEIQRIDYSDKFTRAKATMLCEQIILMPGFTDKPMKVPIPSTWKVERGKWYWYVDREALRQSPFGKMTAGAGAHTGTLPAAIPDNTDFVMKLVKADKEQVELKPGMSEKVIITNSAPGNMDLTIEGEIPGVEAKLAHTQLKVGDQAVLTLKGGDVPHAGLLTIRVQQTGLMIPIQVVIPQ